MTKQETLLVKLALLAEWQYLCHDDCSEEDMNEDQYWNYLKALSTEQLSRMVADDFDADRTPKSVLDLYTNYLSHKFQDLIPQ